MNMLLRRGGPWLCLLLGACDDAQVGRWPVDARVIEDAAIRDAGADSPVNDASMGPACNLALVDAGTLAPTLAYGGSGPSATAEIATGTRVTGGRQFEVTEDCVVITDLAVWDHFSDGLSRDHAVALFALSRTGLDAPASLVPGGEAVAGAGRDVPIEREFRIAPLATPILLERGFYAVVAYDFSTEEPYGLGASEPDPASGLRDVGFDPLEASSEPSPYYPRAGDENARATASFRYVIAR